MQIMLAEGALGITSRLNVEQMAAASIALTVRCIRCCLSDACACLSTFFPYMQMSGPSSLPFDLDKQNTVLLELATQMVVPAGVNSVRPVQVSMTCSPADAQLLQSAGVGCGWLGSFAVPNFPSHLLVQVDIWPTSDNGTSSNVTFTVIAQHTVVGVTGISQVRSGQHALW